MKKVLLLIALGFLTSCVSYPTNSTDKPTQEQIWKYDDKLLAEVAHNLIDDFPHLFHKYSHADVHRLVWKNFSLAKKYKMDLTGSIYVLTGYELFFGKPINELDKQGKITEILNSNDDELIKMKQINQIINELEEQNIIIADESLL